MHSEGKQIESILRKCRKNNRGAQKKLYEIYYSYGMSICLRYAENRQDAVEIMNDGFMRVFQYIRKFNLDKPFKPWFRRIMINCAIDHFKKSQKQIETTQLDDAGTLLQENVLEGRISYADMISIVQRLPDAYRTVFNLIAIEGYKHEEVAAILNISIGTSKSNYHRARQKLQEYLTNYFIRDEGR